MRDVAKYVRLSKSHLGRLIRRQLGVSYPQLLREIRMERSVPLLKNRTLSVKEVAAQLGYAYATEFDRDFRRRFGTSPTRWRNRCQESVVVLDQST